MYKVFRNIYFEFYNKYSDTQKVKMQFFRHFIIPENSWIKGFRMDWSIYKQLQTDIMTQNTSEQKSMSLVSRLESY